MTGCDSCLRPPYLLNCQAAIFRLLLHFRLSRTLSHTPKAHYNGLHIFGCRKCLTRLKKYSSENDLMVPLLESVGRLILRLSLTSTRNLYWGASSERKSSSGGVLVNVGYYYRTPLHFFFFSLRSRLKLSCKSIMNIPFQNTNPNRTDFRRFDNTFLASVSEAVRGGMSTQFTRVFLRLDEEVERRISTRSQRDLEEIWNKVWQEECIDI
ncbi:uncharacterized protein P884DRAFT_111544 [Thermothelomyces heterothallicus CBS 202.75]|uniref:uncharacterized protein n=1 Tax=Thermothelomyces heterothallicus CBS 202.75 TaxID=1149848 RepID=UPI003743CE2B